MKKLHPLFAVAVVMLAVAACQDEAATPQPGTITEQPGKGQDAVDECPRSDEGECL